VFYSSTVLPMLNIVSCTPVPFSAEYEMKIKTMVMKISRMEESTVKITTNGEDIEQVNKFCYLGRVVTQGAKCHTGKKEE